MYALKLKGERLSFTCVSKTKEEFEKRKNAAFWNLKGISARGNSLTVDDFLSDFDQVEIEIKMYKPE